ncbi:MAG: transposase family protein [Parachlamydia sp.]|nr:transposase family protein [Parachlamydia sp.]
MGLFPGYLCGANDLEAIVVYAKEKEIWLKNFLDLRKGIPCYGTFWWIYALLKPSELEQCFVEWVQSIIRR